MICEAERCVRAQDSFEMQADAIQPGQTVVVVDDLIATGASLASDILVLS